MVLVHNDSTFTLNHYKIVTFVRKIIFFHFLSIHFFFIRFQIINETCEILLKFLNSILIPYATNGMNLCFQKSNLWQHSNLKKSLLVLEPQNVIIRVSPYELHLYSLKVVSTEFRTILVFLQCYIKLSDCWETNV